MTRNGWITATQRDAAQAQPLGLTSAGYRAVAQVGGYYMEEVRRKLIDLFGETADDGPHSVYAGGLWVPTAYDDAMQQAMAKALRAGFIRYDRGKGGSGPLATIEAHDKWQRRRASSITGIDSEAWPDPALLHKPARQAPPRYPPGSAGRLTYTAAKQ